MCRRSRGRITRSGRISWPLGLTAGTQKTMTGAQNARFVSRVQGISGAAADRIVEFAREFSELGDFFDMPVSTYSSGMRSRLNFAIAMCFDFDTYIIDELTATGDKNFKQKSREFFTNKRRVAGLVKVSHDAGELREECDAGIVLGGGELRFYDDIAEAFSFYEAQGYAPMKTPFAAIARGVGTHLTRSIRCVRTRQMRRYSMFLLPLFRLSVCAVKKGQTRPGMTSTGGTSERRVASGGRSPLSRATVKAPLRPPIVRTGGTSERRVANGGRSPLSRATVKLSLRPSRSYGPAERASGASRTAAECCCNWGR